MFAYEMSKARIADLHRDADNWRLSRAAQARDNAARQQVSARRAWAVLRALWPVRRRRGTA
jgi:hypothetical protein